CGTPVITSNNSALKEVAGQAAMLVDPSNVGSMTEALVRIADDAPLRQELSTKGLARAAEFSWEQTGRLTLAAYHDAAELGLKRATTWSDTPVEGFSPRFQDVAESIERAIDYAKLFQYPLLPDELRERLFGVKVDEVRFQEVLKSIQYEPDPRLITVRAKREK